jgi:hypothetical protein
MLDFPIWGWSSVQELLYAGYCAGFLEEVVQQKQLLDLKVIEKTFGTNVNYTLKSCVPINTSLSELVRFDNKT